jgi:HAD superfamily hydrolase (TIGR01509 family)
MTGLPQFSAVILDMDGLVLDTEKTYRMAWQRATTELGYDLSVEFFLSLAGLQYQDVEDLIANNCDQNFPVVEFRALSSKHWHDYVDEYGVDVKPGLFDLLHTLEQSRTRFCLATNSLKANADDCLRLAGIADVFSIMVTRDQVQQGKPAPDIFLRAADLMQQPISECLVVEDSEAGITAAIAAGAIPVLIPENEQTMTEFNCYQFNNLTELAMKFKRFRK